MSVFNGNRFVERLQFFNGQRLTAEDLEGIDEFNRSMRWLHNRSLHQPGIGAGFALSAKKGDRSIKIGPGYALDWQGREIILTEEMTLQIPPVAGDPGGLPAVFDLTVQYPEENLEENLEEAETRLGVCDTQGVVRLIEEPVFCWVRLQRGTLNQLHPDDRFQQEILGARKIILGRVYVRECRVDANLDTSIRRDARPTCLPHIASGEVDSPVWEVDGQASGPVGGIVLHLTARIDTRSGGFKTVPNYSATLVGDRVLMVTQEPIYPRSETGGEMESTYYYAAEPAVLSTTYEVVVLDHTSILSPTPEGFIADVLLSLRLTQPIAEKVVLIIYEDHIIAQMAADGHLEIDDLQAFVSKWKLQWMGVEG